jgi:glycyl-tRNA synthetase beta chain
MSAIDQESLLVALFTEELPPKALKKLGDAFADGIRAGLNARGLCAADAAHEMFATPRRLAVSIAGVASVAPDRAESKKLMPAKVALNADGTPSAALQKRLEREGATFAQTSRRTEGAEDVLYLDMTIKGVNLQEGLQAALNDAIAKMPIPKVMTYQLADGLSSVQFVRPVHGLVAMHGASVVPVSAFGITALNIVHGHRFQGAQNIVLNHASEYESRLEREGGVIASFEKRRHEIERLLMQRADECGDTLGDREDYVALLDEVTALVEWPTVYVGQFEQEFLEVPSECLILTMKLNQKYFPLFQAAGNLSSRFLIVSNMRMDDPRNVIEGNQRVVRPRLSDARFFFQTDKKTKLADRLPKLASVVYHNKLGSQGERVGRVRAIAKSICELIAPNGNKDGQFQALVDQAAQLAKADLVTDMVGEFPELQGTMGKYYALNEGIHRDVAEAIEDHYKPRFAGDALPRSKVGVVVALADKLETLVGMFGIGQLPTGDKDPFALRRHALGVVRILVESGLPCGLSDIVSATAKAFGAVITDPTELLTNFVLERFAGSLREQGYSAQEVDAVLSQKPERLVEVKDRLAAVRTFAALSEAPSLAAANKRIGNILKKAESVKEGYDKSRTTEAAETALAAAMESVVPSAKSQFDRGDYTASLKSLAALREPVDTFFDQVMVNAEDPVVRANRLGLLATLHREMNRVADLSKLAA